MASRLFFQLVTNCHQLDGMLYYIQTGHRPTTENADINDIDDVVTRVKMREEVTTEYMRQCDKEYIIKRETIAETKKEVALEIIRFDRKYKVPSDITRERIKSFRLSEDEIDNLFAQIEEEEKALV